MKKTRLFAIISLLFISGCNFDNPEKFFLSFEDSENIVLENINFLLNENNSFFQFQNYSTQCDTKSDDENMNLNSSVLFSGFLDTNKNETLDLYPKIYFFDKKKHSEVSTSGMIQNLYTENQYFTKFSGFSIEMGKGNYETNLRYMIINNLSDKWIKYNSARFDDIRHTQKDIKFLLNTLSSSSTFENIEQVTYEGDNAYKVAIKQDILDFIKNQTNIEIVDFDGLFIIRGDDGVDLKINNMKVTSKNSLGTKTFTINGIIGEDNGVLNFIKDEETLEIVFEMHRKYTKIDVSKSINFSQLWKISTNISKSQKGNSNKFNIKGDIQISPMVIYGSDLENDLKINIKCLYENFSGEDSNLMINEPESYVLLDQILGDEFSIKNFIGDK